MITGTMNQNPEKCIVISLKEARTTYLQGKCRHTRVIVDEHLSTVECEDCHSMLNPIAVLLRFAREESRWSQKCEELKDLHRKLDARIRCKCQHCGQMTRIIL